MKKYYAYSQVKQDIARWSRSKSEAAKKRAIKTSLDNNFVSEFTSLLVVLPQADTNSRSSGSLDPNVYLTGSGGMNQMSHSLVVDSKLQFTDDERSDLPEDPCRITLYSGPQHTGDSLSLSSSVPDLGPGGTSPRYSVSTYRATAAGQYMEVRPSHQMSGFMSLFREKLQRRNEKGHPGRRIADLG